MFLAQIHEASIDVGPGDLRTATTASTGIKGAIVTPGVFF
jgi:hypothetical protein